MSMEPLDSRKERELKMVAEWNRWGRLMQEAIQERIEFDDSKLSGRVTRYSLLKTYLNDSLIREIAAGGDKERACEMRKLQRKRYAILLSEFAHEALEAHRKSKEHRIASVSWTDHQHAVRSAFRIQLTVFELRVAFALHGIGLTVGGHLAARACTRIQYCFPAPQKVVPIRPIC